LPGTELLLVNPKHRKRRRKMSALQKSYFGKNPRRHRRRRSLLSSNPRRHRRYSRNPKSRRVRYNFSSNPANFSLKQVTSEFGPAVIGAGGALVVDWIFGNIPLPPTLTTGIMLPVTRIGAAIGVGVLAGMIAGKATGEKVAVGALVVTSYSIIKNFLTTNVPSLTLARFVPSQHRLSGLGYVGPARIPGGGLNRMPRMAVTGTPHGGHGYAPPTMGRIIANR
jgi:hypothetical protein